MHLSQSFFKPTNVFCGTCKHTADVSSDAQAHTVVVQLFHHRHIEFLLRFIRFKKRITGEWKEIHEDLQFAQTRGLTTYGMVAGDDDSHDMPNDTGAAVHPAPAARGDE